MVSDHHEGIWLLQVNGDGSRRNWELFHISAVMKARLALPAPPLRRNARLLGFFQQWARACTEDIILFILSKQMPCDHWVGWKYLEQLSIF